MKKKANGGGLDYFRIVAALLVVAIHTSPLTTWSADADFFLTRVLARIAVPFFFMVTGSFVLSDRLYRTGSPAAAKERVRKSLRKTAVLYAVATALYIPIGIYAGHYTDLKLSALLRMLVFDGTFYHLWYFPACILGMLLVCLLGRIGDIRFVTVVSFFTYIVGVFGDSWYGIAAKAPVLKAFYEQGFTIWSYTRNGVFFAPLFLVLGAIVGRRRDVRGGRRDYVGLAASFLLMMAEAFILRHFGVQRHDSMYLTLVPVMLFFYRVINGIEAAPAPSLRTAALWIYILHPAMIIAVRVVARLTGLSALTENSLCRYCAVAGLSVAAAAGITVLAERRKRRTRFTHGRAWVELNREALENNVRFFQSRLPEGCVLMPAVKAEAYGHGAVAVARMLQSLGIRAFCVACVQEGVALRRAGIRGEILILGYTHPRELVLLRRYHLTQTVVDGAYAQALRRYGKRIHVHVGIDTGMRRLGERSDNMERILEIFRVKNLVVDGIFTHLSADDAQTEANRLFTRQQAQEFYRVLDELARRGIVYGRIHLQASYGVLNYPEFAGDYARVGIGLYGVLSAREDIERWQGALCPVLSLKARVAGVRTVYAGETAGYGLSFVAERTMRIAALTIGYADGLPRALSNGVGAVLIDGWRAPIVGLVCMDQTLVDVSDIPHVRAGDTAVVMGKSGDLEITACDIAEQAGTIANEILSRIGGRVRENRKSDAFL
ncbi:MAG: serine racemase VanT catalytic subunit [Roseburia sp.]|nr:serine racemase VanT catalytic subunit [Roseburia sp.]